MTREEKLEEAVRAAMRLRKAIEREPAHKVKALFVPVEAVRAFDAKIEELKCTVS